MSKYAQDIISYFNSPSNREYLATVLVNSFNDPKVLIYLQKNFNNIMKHFTATIKEDIYLSDPLPGITIIDVVKSYNAQFLEDRVAFIKTHITGGTEAVPIFSVNDGIPTTRENISHYEQSANNILDSWKNNSGRNVQLRSDSQSDFGTGETTPHDGMVTGVAFCDQSHLGTSQHYEALTNGLYFRKLNKFPLYQGAFGDGGYDNGESDKKLLSRRIFRSSEDGVENGIPRYERRLYVRNIERDLRDTLPGVERDCIIQRHDMNSLYCRTGRRPNPNRQY